MSPPAQRFGGIKVTPMTSVELLRVLRHHLRDDQQIRVTFLNPDYARRAFTDPRLMAHINEFDLVLVDGNGVRLLAPLFGFRVPERLDTDAVGPRVLELLSELSASVYLFGCAPGTALRAARRITAAFPGVVVAGTEHGFHDIERGHPGRFDASDSRRIVAAMNDSGADLVVVSLPTPLQQSWVAEHAPAIEARVVMTAGSWLDHVAVNEAFPGAWYPNWADALALNWFYRLVREPRRLWRRYTVEIAGYLVLTIRALLGVSRRNATTPDPRPVPRWRPPGR